MNNFVANNIPEDLLKLLESVDYDKAGKVKTIQMETALKTASLLLSKTENHMILRNTNIPKRILKIINGLNYSDAKFKANMGMIKGKIEDYIINRKIPRR